PADIDTVILTHLHFDHVEFAHKYTNAQFVVQKAELDMARNPHPILTSFYNDWSRKMWEGVDLKVVEGDNEITDGVRVLLTPGHAVGGQSVAINTSAGTAVIPGICSVQVNYEESPIIPTGSIVNLLQIYDSMNKVFNMADIIVTMHDEQFVTRERIP
ncbi:MBL fold metallo-hydrolase, partial [Chloroflexota bacterium]